METNNASGWQRAGHAMAKQLKLHTGSLSDFILFDSSLRKLLWLLKRMKQKQIPFFYDKGEMIIILEIMLDIIDAAADKLYEDDPTWSVIRLRRNFK